MPRFTLTLNSKFTPMSFFLRISLLAVLSLPFSSALCAQQSADFENFGRQVFALITDTSAHSSAEFARLRVLREWIDSQEISAKEREKQKLALQENYGQDFEHFMRSTALLIERYQSDRDKGAQYEFLDFSYEASAQKSDHYQGKITFLYQSKDMRSMAHFEFPFIYHGRGFALVAPVREVF